MHCPLCGCADGGLVRRFEFASIWHWLERQHGACFPQELIDAHSPEKSTSLLECRDCGLEYFSPATAGNSEFYSCLTSSDAGYYNCETWDFHCAVACVQPGSRLLDVACGKGAFLSFAAKHGVEARGIDTNPDAVSEAQALGLSAHLVDLHLYRQENAGSFDVVTALQVLEHLDDIVPFVEEAALCLRPGGRLLISVPNRHRLWRQYQEPLDCPPHHLSRWSETQFERLASLCGLELKQIHVEPPTVLDLLVPLYRRQKQPVTASSIGKTPSLFNRERLRPFLAPLRRPSSLLKKLGLRRHGMLAEFTVPASR